MIYMYIMIYMYNLHRWKAVDLSFSDIRAKIDSLQPSDRQNFANALGQKCIHDLRLRLISTLNCNFMFLF